MSLLRGPVTRALGIAGVLLGLLGVGAVVFAILELLSTNPARPIVGIGTALLLTGYGALLIAVARGVYRGRRWSRGPGVATSLIQLPVAWSFAGGETWWIAVALAGASIGVLVCLLIRSSTVVFVPDATKTDPDRR